MKIYTCQKSDFLDNIDENGYIKYSHYDSEESIFCYDDSISALHWLESEFDKRMVTPRDRNMIWVWPKWQNYFNEDMAQFDMNIYIFEVPMAYYKQNILWSNFYDWHMVLAQVPDYNYSDIFNIDKHTAKDDVQGVTTRLNISWLKEIRKSE